MPSAPVHASSSEVTRRVLRWVDADGSEDGGHQGGLDLVGRGAPASISTRQLAAVSDRGDTDGRGGHRSGDQAPDEVFTQGCVTWSRLARACNAWLSPLEVFCPSWRIGAAASARVGGDAGRELQEPLE